MKKKRHTASPVFGSREYFEWVLDKELYLFWDEVDAPKEYIIDGSLNNHKFFVKNCKKYEREEGNISLTLFIFNLDGEGDEKYSRLSYSKDGEEYACYRSSVWDLIINPSIGFGKNTDLI